MTSHQSANQQNNPFVTEFQQRYAGKTYYQQIAQHLEKSTVAYPLCFELRSLQGINLLHLQKDLLREYHQITVHGDTSEEQLLRIRKLFAEYGQYRDIDGFIYTHLHNSASALQAFEAMDQREVVPKNEPLYIHRVVFPELAELNSKRPYPLSLRKLAKGRHALSGMKESAEQALREQQLRRIWIVETRTRFAMAIAGGLMLIIPMLIMTLVPSRTTSLLTVSIAVLIFSVLVAIASTAKPQEVLGATAAYAAVLVVFIGTSIPTN